jgi:hypothetical protein
MSKTTPAVFHNLCKRLTATLERQEAKSMMKKISANLAEKSGKPWLVVGAGYGNACMSIAIV